VTEEASDVSLALLKRDARALAWAFAFELLLTVTAGCWPLPLIPAFAAPAHRDIPVLDLHSLLNVCIIQRDP
jgi:hypothetical protein